MTTPFWILPFFSFSCSSSSPPSLPRPLPSSFCSLLLLLRPSWSKLRPRARGTRDCRARIARGRKLHEFPAVTKVGQSLPPAQPGLTAG
eukprot:4098669-Pyramimonas_sp.AAC.1